MRPTWLEIDLGALGRNYRRLARRAAGARVIAVVKANAYGHGAAAVARALLGCGAERLAVATSGEGAGLRRAGIDAPVLLLGSLHPDDAEDAARWGLTPTLVTLEAARAYAAARPGGGVQVKVDSGMGRVGVAPGKLAGFVAAVEELGLEVEAVYTHFAVADEDEIETKRQLAVFLEAARALPRRYPLHAANSAAILAGLGTELDFVRPGVALYGLPPDMRTAQGLEPVLAWKARPTQVKRLPAGHGVGYGLSYRSQGEEWIATLPFGYADGFPRALSNRGWVRWRGGYAPVAGRVSMDQTTVRLPGPVGLDEVFWVATPDLDERTSLTGRARALDTIHYELATALSPRLPRVYREDG
ncbi:alanine racemase [Oceanithermus sp.]|uniref:alanine racemase n=1 Tax=Oceanithermus sp. TaxID=2268145 RepID=UPI002579B14F|nr:alanine racemase [Oceanithermus sp.]